MLFCTGDTDLFDRSLWEFSTGLWWLWWWPCWGWVWPLARDGEGDREGVSEDRDSLRSREWCCLLFLETHNQLILIKYKSWSTLLLLLKIILLRGNFFLRFSKLCGKLSTVHFKSLFIETQQWKRHEHPFPKIRITSEKKLLQLKGKSHSYFSGDTSDSAALCDLCFSCDLDLSTGFCDLDSCSASDSLEL